MFQKTPCPRGKKNREKIIAAFKSSAGTKRQRIKEGASDEVNLACYKWLLIQRSENIQSMEQFYKKKPLVLQNC